MICADKSKPVAWVVGSSSGIGAGIALRLAENGYRVCASARRKERLEALREEHELISPYPLDCMDHDAIDKTARAIIAAHVRIDLLVFAAVLTDKSDASAAGVEAAMRVGILACAHAVEAVLSTMREQNQGHIAIIGSPVGFRALPGARRYGMDKAALHYFAQSLKIDLDASNIAVQLILPGFVKTELTAKNKFPMPFLMELDDAVDRVMRGLAKPQKFQIVFPKRLIWPMRIFGWVPDRLYFYFMRKIAEKTKPNIL
jgi:short-subunit dehydrogenase